MGGPVSDVTQFSWELHISQIKSELKSNVIPIGFVKRGEIPVQNSCTYKHIL